MVYSRGKAMESEKLLNTIRKRHSVRVYKSGTVTDKQLELILEAARWAPSGANRQPWEFVVTRDRAKMKRVRLLWVVPIGHAQSWPKAKPRRKISDFTHREFYDPKKLRQDSEIRAWPKS